MDLFQGPLGSGETYDFSDVVTASIFKRMFSQVSKPPLLLVYNCTAFMFCFCFLLCPSGQSR